MTKALRVLKVPSLFRSSGFNSRRPAEEWASNKFTATNAAQEAIQAFFQRRFEFFVVRSDRGEVSAI